MQTQILDADVAFIKQPFLKPLQLSSGLITEITEARATVRVRVNNREAEGKGSIYLSDLWAWPDPSKSHEQRDGVLRTLCQNIANNLYALCGEEAVHPLELGLRLHHSLSQARQEIPILARALCGSPFDAAIHDAVGQALDCSAFDLYEGSTPFPSADHYFPRYGASNAIKRMIQPPRSELSAWLLIGANDNLSQDVAPTVRERGFRCFKLKLLAQDNNADVARTIEIFRALQSFGVATPRLSVDTNEANADAEMVQDYLEQLRAKYEAAFDALEYLEQPTGRDITQHAFDWRKVTQLKPVFLDEGLTDLDLMEEAKQQGWSGFALKTCKGHSFALVAAAWACENGLKLTMQDLTNPGLAAIHSALFAAHIPTENGIELNSPQYTPKANSEWLPRLNGLFEPSDGLHQVPLPAPIGLGSTI